MASALVRDLIDAGVHFGHRANRWNPKMAPYIFGKRNSIHIIDIRETVKGLLRAKKFLSALVSRGHSVLFVGTKRQARESLVKQATHVGMPYVSERWLGGTLTNFKTIRSRLGRLEEIEADVRSGKIESYSKKMRSVLERERRKITRNLEGVREMKRLPGALLIVDVRREHIAVNEARKLGIPTVCIVDTDSNPDTADILIPGNDDAMRAVEIILEQLSEAIEIGKRSRPSAEDGDQAGPARTDGPRRSRRLTTSELAAQQLADAGADDGPKSESAGEASPKVDAAPMTPIETSVADAAAPAPSREVQDAAKS